MNYFDQIAQELRKQKQRLDNLEAENRELHQQIADLRSGQGIFVDISGVRFSLREEPSRQYVTSSKSW